MKLILLGFALDVATAERDRLAAQLAYVEEAIKLATRRRDRLEKVITDAADIINHINGHLAYVRDQLHLEMDPAAVRALVGVPKERTQCGAPKKKDTVLVTLKYWARQVAQLRAAASSPKPPEHCEDTEDAETALENNVLALLKYSSLAGYQQYYSRLERHEAAIAAHRAIRKKDLINAREREQLISRSLDGLALFYQGGITKEDVVRLAALVEGLAIAVGVNR